MRNVTLKGIGAHKTRLALTAIAIMLGVAFISGTYILTDTLHNTFSVLVSNVYSKIDFQIRGLPQLVGDGATRKQLPQALLARVDRVPGVEAADGNVSGYAQFLTRSGKAISTGGSPTLGLSFNPHSQISTLHVIAGGPPKTSDDVVMDAGTAQQHGFKVGQRVRILLPGPPRTFTISGIAQFGSANNLAGVTLAAFTLPTAQHLFDSVGKLNTINAVARPGADKAAVRRAITAILPPGVQVVTGQTVANEQASAVNQALASFSTSLLIFALIALFVAAFTIFNTFSISVGQRTRELALLRIVGASRRQIFRSVLAEAAIVGTASSIVGIGLGVLAAIGLEALLRGFGVTLPPGSLTFEPRTVVVALAVGVGVTIVSAIGPARRAVRVPPVAALASQRQETTRSYRYRIGWGTALVAAGAFLLGIGLAKSAIALVGGGAASIFFGVTALAPLVARSLSGLIGRPAAALFKVPGKLGRRNSMRSPQRTAQTAAALMIGLAMVSAIAVFGASASKSATSSFDDAVSANLLISSNGTGPLAGQVPGIVASTPGVITANTIYRSQFEIRGVLETLTATSTTQLASTVLLRMTAGSVRALSAGQLLVDSTTAAASHLAVGDSVKVRFAETGVGRVKIGGIYQANALIGSYVASDRYFLSHYSDPNPAGVLAHTNGSSATTRAITQRLAAFPNVSVQTRDQYVKASTASISQVLNLVYALLALAVIIALIGIVNTLMLSIFERTREIGLLRAVGLSRRQVRSMVRSEAVILAIFGAVIGIVVGTGLGLALVASLRHQGITEFDVPTARLVAFLVIAAVLGLAAAGWPARRAARLDVLAAIATE